MPGYLQDQLWIRSMPSSYTPKQVAAYLSAINVLPHSHFTTEANLASGNFPRGLETLSEIVKGHLLAFPFENTEMHYAATKTMNIAPQAIYHRLVVEGKGTFCFGHNSLLLGMLRGLGFRAYGGSARVNMNWQDPTKPRAYGFQSHMIVFVQPFDDSTETYVVDVGFGGSGLTRPIPLMDGTGSLTRGAGPSETHRLVREPFGNSSLGRWANSPLPSGQDMWNLEVLHTGNAEPKSQWKRVFSFDEREFFPDDCVAASAQVVASIPLFKENVFAIRHVLDEEAGDGELCRVILWGKEVKVRRRSGKTDVLATLRSELDRLNALRDIFGIAMEDGDVAFVRGSPASLE